MSSQLRDTRPSKLAHLNTHHPTQEGEHAESHHGAQQSTQSHVAEGPGGNAYPSGSSRLGRPDRGWSSWSGFAPALNHGCRWDRDAIQRAPWRSHLHRSSHTAATTLRALRSSSTNSLVITEE